MITEHFAGVATLYHTIHLDLQNSKSAYPSSQQRTISQLEAISTFPGWPPQSCIVRGYKCFQTLCPTRRGVRYTDNFLMPPRFDTSVQEYTNTSNPSSSYLPKDRQPSTSPARIAYVPIIELPITRIPSSGRSPRARRLAVNQADHVLLQGTEKDCDTALTTL